MTAPTTAPRPIIPACDEGHAHHWVLDPPNGPTVTGVCKHCHRSRDYRVDLYEADAWRDWKGSPASDRGDYFPPDAARYTR